MITELDRRIRHARLQSIQPRAVPAPEVRADPIDFALRPRTFRDYIGQPELVQRLQIALGAAKARGEAMEHVLLHGPPGLGKTTMAQVIANEAGSAAHIVTATAIEDVPALVAWLLKLRRHDVLFVDEIHRLDPVIAEQLYPAMEDGQLDIPGRGRVALPAFTLIGATTHAAKLPLAMISRFGINCHLEHYQPDALGVIIRANAAKLRLALPDAVVAELAARARGTPRLANHLLRRLRDYAAFVADGVVSVETTQAMLRLEGIDAAGLTNQDRRLLRVLIEVYGGGPAGIMAIAASLGEEHSTVAEVMEPYLVRTHFVKRTPRGRCVTDKAYTHLGLDVPEKD
jgi:Holliday junction DNA helicase RuvB